MAYSVEDIEGVGKSYAAKLEAAGYKTADGLLEAGKTPAGRRKIADETGISEAKLLTWVNHCDLMRINGVGPQTSELLEAAGVDTVKELRRRNADNLWTAMSEANAKRNLVNQMPSAKQVQGFIDQAKEMKPVVNNRLTKNYPQANRMTYETKGRKKVYLPNEKTNLDELLAPLLHRPLAERLEAIAQLAQSLQMTAGPEKLAESSILDFAGAWAAMPGTDEEIIAAVRQARQFTRSEISLD